MSDKRRACSLCGAPAPWLCRQRLLDKYDVDYFQCTQCDLIQTERPYWLEEAYTQAISQLDTGAMQRNEAAARLTALLATLVDIPPSARCLDFGGGHGVFVRMMRDLGLDFRWFDKYGENLFARGFEGDVAEHHTLVTAFEVIEHLADVRTDLDALFAPSPDYVLVGTVLHEGHRTDWWYYMLESGQHVAFFSRKTLAWIAETYGYDVLTASEYSLFVRRDRALGSVRKALVSRLLRRPTVLNLVPGAVLRRLAPYRSRMEADHREMRTRTRS
jgi:hypothetical protein